MPKRIVLLSALLMLAFSSVCLAEHMSFVDSEGATGYYVDVDSIVVMPAGATSENICDATTAVVKVRENRRYLYKMQFDRGLNKYRIFETTVQVYDTKKVLENRWNPTGWQPYGLSSPMHAIVEYIYELRAEEARKNAKSY